MAASLQKRVIREDLTSLGGVVSQSGNGSKLITGVKGKRIKVYDAGYDAAATGLHYFYFGTDPNTQTSKTFCTINRAGVIHQTFVQPRVGDDGDSLFLFSSSTEVNMAYDLAYAQE